MHPAVQEWTTNSSIERLRTLMASINLDQLAPSIDPLVMDTERGRAWTALFNAELEEMQESRSPATAATVAPMEDAAPSAPVPPSSGDGVEPMEVAEDAPDNLERPERPKVNRLERLRQETTNRSEENEPEPTVDVVLGSQPWHSQVPQVTN